MINLLNNSSDSKLMQRALPNTLMTENGTEKLDNELITTLFENITTFAQLFQFGCAEGKTIKDKPPRNQKKRQQPNRSLYPGFHQQYAPLTAFQTCLLATLPFLTNAVYSSYDAGTIKPSENVTCMAGIHK